MLRRASARPDQMLRRAYDEHANELYRYALIMLADHQAAEDAVQQTFVKALKLRGRLLEIESHHKYLRATLRNECYDIIKRRNRQGRTTEAASARAILVEPADRAVAEDERELVEAAIRALPPEQREVLHMKVYEGRTFEQIGNMISISANTAASRYRYAINKLRERLASNHRTGENCDD